MNIYIVPTVDLTESKKDHKKIQKKSPPKSRNIKDIIYSTNSRPDRIKKRSQKNTKKKNHSLNQGISKTLYIVPTVDMFFSHNSEIHGPIFMIFNMFFSHISGIQGQILMIFGYDSHQYLRHSWTDFHYFWICFSAISQEFMEQFP